jgi:hypothetical protein
MLDFVLQQTIAKQLSSQFSGHKTFPIHEKFIFTREEKIFSHRIKLTCTLNHIQVVDIFHPIKSAKKKLNFVFIFCGFSLIAMLLHKLYLILTFFLLYILEHHIQIQSNCLHTWCSWVKLWMMQEKKKKTNLCCAQFITSIDSPNQIPAHRVHCHARTSQWCHARAHQWLQLSWT